MTGTYLSTSDDCTYSVHSFIPKNKENKEDGYMMRAIDSRTKGSDVFITKINLKKLIDFKLFIKKS